MGRERISSDLYKGSSKKNVDPHPRPREETPMLPKYESTNYHKHSNLLGKIILIHTLCMWVMRLEIHKPNPEPPVITANQKSSSNPHLRLATHSYWIVWTLQTCSSAPHRTSQPHCPLLPLARCLTLLTNPRPAIIYSKTKTNCWRIACDYTILTVAMALKLYEGLNIWQETSTATSPTRSKLHLNQMQKVSQSKNKYLKRNFNHNRQFLQR